MQRISFIIATLVALLSLQANAKNASEVFAQVSPSVVVVVAYDAAGQPASLGSGVALPDSSVATNCHVLKDGQQYRVRYHGKDYPAQLSKTDWDRDVCSLTVPGLKAPPVTLGDSKTLKVGAPIYAIGTPEGLELTLSEGIVSSLRDVGGGSYIQTTAAISPGSSGGGLFDDQGRLLGLTSFSASQGQQLNFALPVEWIEALPQHSSRQPSSQRLSEVDWLNRASGLEKKNDWNGLLALTEQWTAAEPISESAWIFRSDAHDALQQYGEAVLDFHQVLLIYPESYGAWAQLGGAYLMTGQSASAVAAEQRALRIDPSSSLAWGLLGATYIGTQQYPDAIDAFQQSLRINPQDAPTWVQLGIADYKSDHYPEAIVAEQQALRLDSTDAGAWKYLGESYGGTKQYTDAAAALQQALRINPQDAETWAYLAADYVGTQQYSDALTAAQRAVRIDPSSPDALLALGMTYHYAGEDAPVIPIYQKLKGVSPKYAEILFKLCILPQ